MEENGRKRQRERERKIEMRRRQVRRQKMILEESSRDPASADPGAGSTGNRPAVPRKKPGQRKWKNRNRPRKPGKEPEKVSLTISAAGDCTLEQMKTFIMLPVLPAKYEAVQDPGYFFQKVLPSF